MKPEIIAKKDFIIKRFLSVLKMEPNDDTKIDPPTLLKTASGGIGMRGVLPLLHQGELLAEELRTVEVPNDAKLTFLKSKPFIKVKEFESRADAEEFLKDESKYILDLTEETDNEKSTRTSIKVSNRPTIKVLCITLATFHFEKQKIRLVKEALEMANLIGSKIILKSEAAICQEGCNFIKRFGAKILQGPFYFGAKFRQTDYSQQHLGEKELKDFQTFLLQQPSLWGIIAKGPNNVPIWDIIKENHNGDIANANLVAKVLEKAFQSLNSSSALTEYKDKLKTESKWRTVLSKVNQWRATDAIEKLETLLDLKMGAGSETNNFKFSFDERFKGFLSSIQKADEENLLENTPEVKRLLRKVLSQEDDLMPNGFYQWLFNDSRSNSPATFKDLQSNLKSYLTFLRKRKGNILEKRHRITVVTKCTTDLLSQLKKDGNYEAAALLSLLVYVTGYSFERRAFREELDERTVGFLLDQIREQFLNIFNLDRNRSQAWIVSLGMRLCVKNTSTVSSREKGRRWKILKAILNKELSHEVEKVMSSESTQEPNWHKIHDDLKRLADGQDLGNSKLDFKRSLSDRFSVSDAEDYKTSGHPRSKLFSGSDSWSPLHHACEQGDVEFVKKLLLDEKVDPNSQNGRKWAPLHLACQNGHSDCVKLLLLDEKVDPNIRNIFNFTPLHLACQNGHFECVRQLLLNRKVCLNIKTREYFTALHLACHHGHTSCVKLLLSNSNVDPDPKAKRLFTPLHLACQDGFVECVKLLLLNPNIDPNSKTLEKLTPLHLACENGYTECMKQLLLTKTVDVNAQNEMGFTPLHLASYKGYDDCVQILLQSKANPYLKNRYQKTPKDLAISNRHHCCIKLFY